MKKTLQICVVILVGIFVLLTVLDYKGEYASQKELWKINKYFVEIAQDPNAAPSASFDKAAAQFNSYLKKFPNSSSTPIAHILLGRAHLLKKDYNKAREIYEEIVVKYKDRPEIAVQAVAEIGRSYADQGDIDGVMRVYDRIVADFPLTDLGLRTPLLKAKYYFDHNELQKASEAFSSAIVYYKQLIVKHPDSDIEYSALRLIASCYLAQERWEEAINVFSEMLLDFADPRYLNAQRAQTALNTINTISIVKLENYDLPIGIYQKFITKYPEHPITPTLEGMIKSFEVLKQKNVQAVESGS